jgi:hypothetical protein
MSSIKLCPTVVVRFPSRYGNSRLSFSGYQPLERRRIEQEAFSGRILGLVATNALELGVDIGVLDAVIVCGFPVSLSSFVSNAIAFLLHVHSHSRSVNKSEEREGEPVIRWPSLLPVERKPTNATLIILTTFLTSLLQSLSSI